MKAPYAPLYSNSHAIVIGINDYSLGDHSPLGFARNDAEAIAKLLKKSFGFPEENVKLLLDQEATRSNIMQSYWNFSQTGTAPDDRLVFFYAGHGGKLDGNYGDKGFLIPCDAQSSDPSSYISWMELTDIARNYFHAKHTLFIADACFSGHAIKRFSPGAKRFIKDMLSRRALQVIASGKSDEPVADEGGPRPGHSPFTGHLLDALEGNAANEEGLLTANFAMSYVYKHVGTGYGLDQTPQYGMLDGEGDFIFHQPTKKDEEEKEGEEKQAEEYRPHIYTYPIEIQPETGDIPPDGIDLIKQYLSSPTEKIKLFDHLVGLYRAYEAQIASHNLSMDGVATNDALDRLEVYEDAVIDLRDAAMCVAHWGTSEHFNILQRLLTRMASDKAQSGGVRVLALQYYPLCHVFMAASISALSAGNYEALHSIFYAKGRGGNRHESSYLEVTIADQMSELAGLFKNLPGHERNHFPMSEYFFKRLQPRMEDILFLGSDYETFFDQYEVLHSLHYRHLVGDDSYQWFPLGRFAWKLRGHSFNSSNPLKDLISQAEQEKENFAPIRFGLFDADLGNLTTRSEELYAWLKEIRLR